MGELDPVELAKLLRNVDHVMRGAQTALMAFANPVYAERLQREHDRLGWARSEVAAVLQGLPPEPPLTPEREAQLGRLLGAVFDKRFGDGGQEAVDAAMSDLFPASGEDDRG